MWKRELIKNKLYALALIMIGFLSIFIEYDATVFIMMLAIGSYLFFAKEDWISEDRFDDEEYEDELSENYTD